FRLETAKREKAGRRAGRYFKTHQRFGMNFLCQMAVKTAAAAHMGTQATFLTHAENAIHATRLQHAHTANADAGNAIGGFHADGRGANTEHAGKAIRRGDVFDQMFEGARVEKLERRGMNLLARN